MRQVQPAVAQGSTIARYGPLRANRPFSIRPRWGRLDLVIETLRRPARLFAAVGVGVVAVAAFLPWVTAVDVKGVSQVLGGFDGAADGFVEFLVGAGLLAVLASRGAQTSRVRTA
jgi:hypothetical protein